MATKLEEYFNSTEGKKSIADFVAEVKREAQILDQQIERLHLIPNLPEFIAKIISKYDSDRYKDRWYSRGMEPPETLYWFLFHYAEKYGSKCNKKEWKKHSNMFTTSLLYIPGYYIQKMDGQGSVIKITKI